MRARSIALVLLLLFAAAVPAIGVLAGNHNGHPQNGPPGQAHVDDGSLVISHAHNESTTIDLTYDWPNDWEEVRVSAAIETLTGSARIEVRNATNEIVLAETSLENLTLDQTLTNASRGAWVVLLTFEGHAGAFELRIGGAGVDATTGGPSTPPPGHSARPANEVARERAMEQRRDTGTDPAPAWGKAMRAAQADADSEQHALEMERLPPAARERFGMLTLADASFAGRYVSFEADADAGALHNVRVGGTQVFESIYFPPEENISARHRGNILELAGDTWRFHIVDAPAAPMHLRSSEFPIQLVLAPGSEVRPQGDMLRLLAPVPGGDALSARLVGDAALDAHTMGLVQVLGEATFQVSAQQVVLPHAANQARPALEQAMERRALGGEVTLLADPSSPRGKAVASEAVPYEDIEILVSAGEPLAPMPANATVHSITVSAHGVPGKTFVVNLEAGLLDLESLSLRYYNIIDGEAIQVPIVAAASLEEALDPTGSGAVPRYWVLQGADGEQILFTVPSFSTHVLELLSVHDIVVKVVLTAGIVGALVVVGLAVAGLFRRPEDTL